MTEGAGLRPADRVKKRGEFRQIQSHGAKVHTRHFILMVHPSLVEADHPRLGVTITKKVGNAVERNRVRRILREVFRRHREVFPAGSDVVIIAKRGAPELGFTEMLDELRRVKKALGRAAEKGPRGKSETGAGRRSKKGSEKRAKSKPSKPE